MLLGLVGIALLGIRAVLHLDRVLLLDALVAVGFTAGSRVGRAGHAVVLSLVVVVRGEAVVCSTGAGARTTLVAKLDKAVDKAVLGGEVREVVVDGQAVRVQRRRDIGEGGRGASGVRNCRGGLLVVCVTVPPEHKLTFLSRQSCVFGSKCGIDSADGQIKVARVAKVEILRRVL